MEEDPVPNMEDDDDEEWAAPEEEDDDDEGFGWLQDELVSRERPAERSGHITVTDRSCLFVWGGYKVRIDCYIKPEDVCTGDCVKRSLCLSFCQNSDTEAAVFTDLYLPKNEVWIYNMETRRW